MHRHSVRRLPLGPQRRVFGQYQGKIQIADDFDAPLPDEFWLSGTP